MAEVLPFPPARRRGFVQRQAARAAEMSPGAGERHLAQQIQIQRDTMVRRGIDPEIVEREMRKLETALRNVLWRVVLTPGGAA